MENTCRIGEKPRNIQENELVYVFECENNRSAVYDKNVLIGRCEFEVINNVWNITHTIVNPGYEGRGIARKLVTMIIDEARKNNVKINPICSYAQKMMLCKEEYKDVL